MEKKFNRILSLLLALIMVIGFVPMGHVHAEEESTVTKYRWVTNAAGDGLVSVLTADGYTENGLTDKGCNKNTGYHYQLNTGFALDPDAPWSIEWKCSGNWGGMLLASNQSTPSDNNQFFMRSASSGSVQFSYYTGTNLKKNRKTLPDGAYDPESEEATVWRIENNVTDNKVYLTVGDAEAIDLGYGADNTLHFGFIGSHSTGTDQCLANINLEYLEVVIPTPAEHVCDFSTEVEYVAGNCQTKGYTVMKCSCGKTTNVEDAEYGDHVYAYSNSNGATRYCTIDGCTESLSGTHLWVNVYDEETSAYAIYDVANDVNLSGDGAKLTATGAFNKFYAPFAKSVTLPCGNEWSIEWKMTGAFSKSMFLTTDTAYGTGDHYLYSTGTNMTLGKAKSKNATWITGINNYTGTHTYRLENVVTKNEETGAYASNVVDVIIDGVEVGTISPSTDFNFTGVDLVFGAIGNSQYAPSGYTLDYLKIDIAPDHQHDFSVFVETVKGEDCQSAGYDVYKCATCEATEQKVNETAVGDHVWGAEPTSSTVGADCKTPGKDTFTCTLCTEGEPVTKEVDNEKYGAHTYGAWSNSNGAISRSCSTCGGSDAATHVWQMEDSKMMDLKNGSEIARVNNMYAIGKVTLPYDVEWTIEWNAKGTFNKVMILAKDAADGTDNQYIYYPAQTATSGSIVFGRNPSHQNGVAQPVYNYTYNDSDNFHTYRIENVVTTEGDTVTNIPYLYVDGKLIGALSGGASAYPSGTNLEFNSMGAGNYSLRTNTVSYMAINVPATEEEETPVASVEDAEGNVTEYEDLNDALAHSGAATVSLLADQSIDELTVPAGVVLDLNGKNLTTNGVWTNGAGIIGDGKLIVAKNAAAFTGDNAGYLPVYDTDGYVFAKVEKVQTTDRTEGNKTTFYFLPEIDADMHEAILAGYEATGVELKIDFTWTANDGADTYQYSKLAPFLRYTDAHISQFLGGYADGSYKYAFKLGVSGVDKIDAGSLQFTAWFEANGVKYEF